jgi:choline-sulfatase
MKIMPNILLLVSDHHNPHFVGCEGVRSVKTPNLDALAARGTRFTHCHAANPCGAASRMAMLTSRRSADTNVWTSQCVLDSRLPTLAHYLRKAGYESIIAGRMHFRGPDQRHGYERRILGDVADVLDPIPSIAGTPQAAGVKVTGPGRTTYTRFDEEVAEVVSEYLQQWDRDPGPRPFFLTVGFTLPHYPYICPRHLLRQYLPRVELADLPATYLQDLHPAMQAWRHSRQVDALKADYRRMARAAYFGMVTYLDEMIGQVMAALDETRFADDTLVIYCSDQGDMAGELGMWWSGTLYQGAVGVPLIMSWPGHIAEGRRVQEICSLLDLAPTLMDLAVEGVMPQARGQSLRPFLTQSGRKAPWPDTALADCVLDGQTPARMVRRGPWKLNVFHGHERVQLFNLDEDPDELDDQGREPQYQAVRDELLALAKNDWDPQQALSHLAQPPPLEKLTQGLRPPAGDDAPDLWKCPASANVFPDAG